MKITGKINNLVLMLVMGVVLATLGTVAEAKTEEDIWTDEQGKMELTEDRICRFMERIEKEI